MDRDERLAFLPLADPRIDEVLPGDAEERKKHSHLVTVDGRDLIGGRSWAAVLAETRTLRWLGRFLVSARLWWVLSPLVWVLDRARGRLGWMMQPGPGPVRFP